MRKPLSGDKISAASGELIMTGLEQRLAEALRRSIPLIAPAHIPRHNERRIALRDAREALAEYDRAVIAETKAGTTNSRLT